MTVLYYKFLLTLAVHRLSCKLHCLLSQTLFIVYVLRIPYSCTACSRPRLFFLWIGWAFSLCPLDSLTKDFGRRMQNDPFAALPTLLFLSFASLFAFASASAPLAFVSFLRFFGCWFVDYSGPFTSIHDWCLRRGLMKVFMFCALLSFPWALAIAFSRFKSFFLKHLSWNAGMLDPATKCERMLRSRASPNLQWTAYRRSLIT